LPETYRVCVQKETMIFSAAHFITFGDDICESLHGHNYGVKVEIEAPLNQQAYVVDFIALRDEMIMQTRLLDHKVILPDSHPLIRVDAQGAEVLVTFRDRRWIFPADNCVILPVANTTAELLASYFGGQLQKWLANLGVIASSVMVGVDENHGQWGIWEWTRR
jgi:6-pyruvoyltetrahydropterin/6-carboxytetrahydropterin synthase